MSTVTQTNPSAQALDLHNASIIIDTCAPILNDLKNAHYWRAGGVTCGFATMSLDNDDSRSTTHRIAQWYRQLGEYSGEVILATTVADIHRAKVENKLAVVLHFQNSSCLDYQIPLIGIFYRMGVRAMILAYNRAEVAGDGCMEERNSGLTRFGREVIKEMNHVGMLVDISHCGIRTSLEAIEVSSKPVTFTHSGAKAIYDHPRNLTDEQIRAVAAAGGVIGINGHALFVKNTTSPSLENLLDHYDYIANLVGTNHVGMGFDFSFPPGTDMPAARYQALLATGVWDKETLPPPPWKYPVENAAKMHSFTNGLLGRGYSAEDVRKILGGNFLSLFDQVWQLAG